MRRSQHRGQLIAFYRAGRGRYFKVHLETDFGKSGRNDWFIIYGYERESGWTHLHRCKDFLKCADKLKELLS